MAARLPTKQASRIRRPRLESKNHLKFIRSLPCCVCWRHGGREEHKSEAAHVRMESLQYAKQNSGIGSKPDDVWTVPLCLVHHKAQHDCGSEQLFWSTHNMDPLALALKLWKHSGNRESAITVLENAR